MAHDAVKQDVARIAVVGDSCHPAIPKETFEALFERPIYIRVGGVVGTQELVREDINIGVGQHSTSPLAIVMHYPSRVVSPPDQGDVDPIVSTRRTPP